MLEERGAGSLAEVAEGMTRKLIRRHPHVFAESEARELLGSDPATSADVLDNWDRIKREVEGRGAEGPFSDVPENLPALLYARKMQRRALSAGLSGAAASERPDDPEEREREALRLGRELFALVDEARRLGIDPELALRAEAERFRALLEPEG